MRFTFDSIEDLNVSSYIAEKEVYTTLTNIFLSTVLTYLHTTRLIIYRPTTPYGSHVSYSTLSLDLLLQMKKVQAKVNSFIFAVVHTSTLLHNKKTILITVLET